MIYLKDIEQWEPLVGQSGLLYIVKNEQAVLKKLQQTETMLSKTWDGYHNYVVHKGKARHYTIYLMTRRLRRMETAILLARMLGKEKKANQLVLQIRQLVENSILL